MLRPMNEKDFNMLLNMGGTVLVGQNEGGVTYRLASGKMIARIHNGIGWEYVALI